MIIHYLGNAVFIKEVINLNGAQKKLKLKEWLPQNIFEVVYFREAIQRVRVYYAL